MRTALAASLFLLAAACGPTPAGPDATPTAGDTQHPDMGLAGAPDLAVCHTTAGDLLAGAPCGDTSVSTLTGHQVCAAVGGCQPCGLPGEPCCPLVVGIGGGTQWGCVVAGRWADCPGPGATPVPYDPAYLCGASAVDADADAR